jgi:hypothetical protein
MLPSYNGIEVVCSLALIYDVEHLQEFAKFYSANLVF